MTLLRVEDILTMVVKHLLAVMILQAGSDWSNGRLFAAAK